LVRSNLAFAMMLSRVGSLVDYFLLLITASETLFGASA
jgi:hypothetical protein